MASSPTGQTNHGSDAGEAAPALGLCYMASSLDSCPWGEWQPPALAELKIASPPFGCSFNFSNAFVTNSLH